MMLSSSWSQQSCLRRYAFFIRGLKDLGDRRWTRHSTWCSILKENSIKGVELTSLETLTFNRGALPHDFLGKHLAVDVSSARTWMSLFNNVRSFFLLSKEGRVPLEGPFVKDISQDHKSSGKFPPGSPLTTSGVLWYEPVLEVIVEIIIPWFPSSSSWLVIVHHVPTLESLHPRRGMSPVRRKGSLWLGCPISRWQATLCFGVLACVLERLSIHSIRASESAKRL